MVLNKNSITQLDFTLNENCILASHDFLFEFTNEITRDVKIFTAVDLNIWYGRYNSFNIIDNTVEIPLAGQMNFDPVGRWAYKVYEMPVASPPSLDPSNSVGIVEVGIVLVKGPEEVIPMFEEPADDDAIPSFNE